MNDIPTHFLPHCLSREEGSLSDDEDVYLKFIVESNIETKNVAKIYVQPLGSAALMSRENVSCFLVPAI